MALNYDLINQDFAVPEGYRRNQDGDYMGQNGLLWDPYDQYMQSLNTAASFGIPPEELARWQSLADFQGMTLDQYIRSAQGDYTTSQDKYGSTIYSPTSGAVNQAGWPDHNAPDGTENGWMLPLMVATAGAADMGMFGDLFSGFGGGDTLNTAGWDVAGVDGFNPVSLMSDAEGAAGVGEGFNFANTYTPTPSGFDFGSTDPTAGFSTNPYTNYSAGGLASSITPNLLTSGALSSAAGAGLGGGGGDSSLWSSLLGNKNLLSSLIGSGVQGLSSYLASNAQQDSAEQANNTLWNMFNQTRTDNLPMLAARNGALSNMVNLTTPGKQFDQMQLDPGYQFRLDQGQDALDNRLRAAGKFYSGSALKAGTDYNQNFASNEFGNIFNRNASLAGLGQTATSATQALGANTANNVANNQTDMGNARASGYMGIGNAVQGGINSYNQQNMLNQLLPLLTRGY